MSKGRLEAFSDGVIAVAITFLVINLVVPPPDKTKDLADALLKDWPHFIAYVISFITIGIIWTNHHAVIGRLRQPDHAILMLNLLLLLWIVVLPFTTDLMATYLKSHHGERTAAAVYAGSLLAMSLTFSAFNYHILYPKSHLLAVELSDERRRQIITRGVFGLIPYTLATALAAVSPYCTLAICAAVAFYYALPIAQGGGQSATPVET